MSYLLFAIEDIGVQLEEPFSVLPLAQICAGLRRDIEQARSRCIL